MSALKSKGFSQIPHGFHKRLAEMTGNQLKVWLAHRCMEGKEGESFPSLDRLVEYTGLNLHTVTDARKWLRANGWLTSSGQKHTSLGKFSIPIEHTAIPEAVGRKTTNGEKAESSGAVCGKTTNGAGRKTTNGAGSFTACGETATEVDPKSFEVDPEKVNPSYQPPKPDGRAAGGECVSENQSKATGKENLTKAAMLDLLREAHFDKWESCSGDAVPRGIPVMGSDELFAKLTDLGITRIDQMEDVTCAYGEWFEYRYAPSFVQSEEARSQAESREDDSTKVFIPKPILCPLVMFAREMKRYLDEAIEEHDDRARRCRETAEWYPWMDAFRKASFIKKTDLDTYLETHPVSAEFATKAEGELSHAHGDSDEGDRDSGLMVISIPGSI